MSATGATQIENLAYATRLGLWGTKDMPSYHADKDCGNHQRRMHYILEPGWRADNVVQGIGRTNRTNQVSAPVVLPVFADVPGEARFKSTIARKLDSLGALTRGQRETGSNGAISADENLESVESKASLNMLLMELSKRHTHLGRDK